MYGAYSVLCERDMMQREVDVAPFGDGLYFIHDNGFLYIDSG